jgi:hypothetical protein
MGHKRIKQTEHYAKVIPQKVSEDMGELQKRLNKKKFLKGYTKTLPAEEARTDKK